MGLASRPSPGARRVEAGVLVIDVFEIKDSPGAGHPPGVVAVLDGFPSPDPQSVVGRGVRFRTPTGHERDAQVEAVRDHGTTISLFFGGLTRADLPAGSRIEFVD